MNEMCTWTNLVHRTNIGIHPLTHLRKGCNQFKILLQFQIFSIKSNENMVWACHLPKRWECPTIFGRKFLEIYVVRR